jgi:hypothetical protein
MKALHSHTCAPSRTTRHLLAGSLFVLALASCSGSNSQRYLLSYVPSSSYAVLAVNWKAVSKDPDLKRISKGAEVEKLFGQLGIDESTVNEFAVFGEPGGSSQASAGLIAKGTFNSSAIVKNLLSRGWREQDLEGRRVYVNPADGSWLTTFDKNLFVLGTQLVVSEAIGARAKPQQRFTSNPAYKTLSAHFEAKQYPIVMMVAFPQGSQDMANAAMQISSTVLDLAGVGPLGELLSKIGYAKGLGCAISRRGDEFPVAVSAVMKDEESAKFVSGALNLLRGLGGMVSKNYAQSDPDTTRAIQTMSVERNREVISVKMTMSRRDVMGGLKP